MRTLGSPPFSSKNPTPAIPRRLSYHFLVESYFSIFKRGMRLTYQHCAEKHLHRYLNEFDFCHNNRIALGVNDTMRAEKLAAGIKDKRLTY